ncbi:exosome complex protein Rrp42 [Methanothermobacter sp. KEPCO-1]|uniref:exosome complex protein Rrp42 n=1 Tax=Methanothermobacter sp. KEPCO-1 TaxID=2603820 RepID=UPI0011CCD784|nr:exosome complex protein Rrp42 [Methanothermobacter sp. KEPCO-1]QEF95119.1 exosome complex protein Rrp42 [Methanothermobacter sp. KEPCO-1]
MVNKMDIIPEITRKSITDLINNKERIDGRSLHEFRDISIETGVISKAEGSSRVKLGNTQIIVGVKPQIGEPFPDTPEMGVILTNSELLPMASPTFEPGPPDERSVELSRVVDRCIRESQMIDLEKLCIIEGSKVWMLFLDLHIIDYDGNLFDAAVLATVAALLDTRIPKAEVEDGEVLVDRENMQPLPINRKALMCTFAKIGDEIILDPCLEEEDILTARLSIGVTEDGSICAMQKGGEGALTRDDVLRAVSIAREKVPQLIEYLDKSMAP